MHTRFNWKNSYKPFFVIIDKRMPAEIKSATKAADEQYLEANKEADEKRKAEAEVRNKLNCIFFTNPLYY